MLRRSIIVGGTLAFASMTTAAHAHHGWEWAEGKTTQVTGVIQSAQLGNPHGLLKLDVKGVVWTVEVGQPWRNESAGLKDAMLVKGVELTILGNRAKDAKLTVIKALRVIIKGKTHNLYPERSVS